MAVVKQAPITMGLDGSPGSPAPAPAAEITKEAGERLATAVRPWSDRYPRADR